MTVSVTAAADVLFRKFGEEAVLLHLKTERYFSLNDSALLMWELLIEGHSASEVAARVAAVYDVTPETVAEDLQALLARLRELELIEVDEYR